MQKHVDPYRSTGLHANTLARTQANAQARAFTFVNDHKYIHARTHKHTHQVLIHVSRLEGWMTLLKESITDIYARLMYMNNLARSLQLHVLYCSCPLIVRCGLRKTTHILRTVDIPAEIRQSVQVEA